MTQQELIEKINTVLADEFEVEQEVITPDAPLLETLDLDGSRLQGAEDFSGLLRPDHQPDEWQITTNGGADARAADLSDTVSSSS